eukprot:732172-Hanusia_phi.AAC.1
MPLAHRHTVTLRLKSYTVTVTLGNRAVVPYDQPAPTTESRRLSCPAYYDRTFSSPPTRTLR